MKYSREHGHSDEALVCRHIELVQKAAGHGRVIMSHEFTLTARQPNKQNAAGPAPENLLSNVRWSWPKDKNLSFC